MKKKYVGSYDIPDGGSYVTTIHITSKRYIDRSYMKKRDRLRLLKVFKSMGLSRKESTYSGYVGDDLIVCYMYRDHFNLSVN